MSIARHIFTFIDPKSKKECTLTVPDIENIYPSDLVITILRSVLYHGDIETGYIPILNDDDVIIRYSENKKDFYYCCKSPWQTQVNVNEIKQFPLAECLRRTKYNLENRTISYDSSNISDTEKMVLPRILDLLRKLFRTYQKHYHATDHLINASTSTDAAAASPAIDLRNATQYPLLTNNFSNLFAHSNTGEQLNSRQINTNEQADPRIEKNNFSM